MRKQLNRLQKAIDAGKRMAVQLPCAMSLQAAFRRVLTAVLQIEEVDSCGAYLVESPSNGLRLVAQRHVPALFAKSVSYYPPDSTPARWIARKKPVYFSTGKRARYQMHEAHRQAGFCALAVIPLVHRGKAIAALVAASKTAMIFSRAGRLALETLALQVASHLARVRAEEALRKSEERYRLITELAFDRISLASLDGFRYLFINRAGAESLGYTQQSLIGRSALDFVHPDDRARVAPLIREAQKKKRVVFDIRYRHRSGEYFWLEVNGQLIRGPEGRPQVLFVSRDITERRQQQAIAAVENEQRRIGRDLHDGLGQHLAGIQMLCSILRKRAEHENPACLQPAMAEIEHLVEQAVGQTNQIARNLLPVPNSPAGLDFALTRLAEMARDVFRVDCRYRGPDNPNLPDNVTATHLFRIAQEAVSNAVRHGRAQRIWIDLRESPRGRWLRIRDNGMGFVVDWKSNRGMGLHNMEYRARQIGGRLDVGNRRPHGTTITCRVRPERRSQREND